MPKQRTTAKKTTATATRRRGSAHTLTQGKKREKLQAAFLTAFRDVCTIAGAATQAGVSRRTHYNWLEADPSYKTQFGDLEAVRPPETTWKLGSGAGAPPSLSPSVLGFSRGSMVSA